jgi:hypothetical protein
MSARREHDLREAGTLTPGSTFASARRVMRVPGKVRQSRPAATEFDAVTVAIILERDHWSCVRCGGGLHGVRGRDWSIQHRRARGAGGSRRPDTNTPQNGLSVCGSGTTGCHGHIEREREQARAHGWAIRQTDDPLTVPVVHALYGHVYLTADATVTSRRPSLKTEKEN